MEYMNMLLDQIQFEKVKKGDIDWYRINKAVLPAALS